MCLRLSWRNILMHQSVFSPFCKLEKLSTLPESNHLNCLHYYYFLTWGGSSAIWPIAKCCRELLSSQAIIEIPAKIFFFSLDQVCSKSLHITPVKLSGNVMDRSVQNLTRSEQNEICKFKVFKIENIWIIYLNLQSW